MTDYRFGKWPDERLVVSADVMACLEADFPEAACLFRVDPVAESFARHPQRWVIGVDPAMAEDDAFTLLDPTRLDRLFVIPDGHEVQVGFQEAEE